MININKIIIRLNYKNKYSIYILYKLFNDKFRVDRNSK